ncbi:class III poly(R)-hydroxyalkanoic acid synthase subunit PhaE [Luteimonas aestuarii]|uniref:Poly(3-hydroxyalkanoate) polymerase subunit PhaE n=1 Tax=Luteimonas aestuarii TaxID=453837 RepID=A0A4R5U450_9GAMM|nr:class III poly(R)-hydroxyalkanoic acid synthase subunit PhaE [Luteimonas aestuarii]TDK28404.1 class III poly(R)-hydroxyalkanoic acid synthase subunit PhaE [Luteimonas aestuarii]
MANGPADFERLARQYWGAWGDAMRNAMPGMAPPDPVRAGTQAWQDAIDWWTRQAGMRPAHEDVLGRFNRQASDWYAQMQQVAARFGGADNTAADVVRAWKDALGGEGAANIFADMLRSMAGRGLQGAEQWSEQMGPMLHAMRTDAGAWLQMPTFGFAREHQERSQALAAAQLECQEASNAFNTLMLKASEAAFAVFERKLSEHEAPGLQISSPRKLFDLWIDAAEEAYAETALSKEYREAYGNLVNAQMRLRAGVQKEVEQATAALGMPTRSELDGAHRKIVELERALRKLRDAAAAAVAPTPAPRREAMNAHASGDVRPKPAAKSRPAKRKAKPAAKARAEAPAARPARKPAAKKVARKRASRAPSRASRAPTNGFSSAIPVAPVPLPKEST